MDGLRLPELHDNKDNSPIFGGFTADMLEDDATMDEFLKNVANNPEAAAALLQTLALNESLQGSNPDNTTTSPLHPYPDITSPPTLPNNLSSLQYPASNDIFPTAGFVIKSSLTSTVGSWNKGMKVFINVCHSADVPPPPTQDYDDVGRAIREGDNCSFRVPLR